MLKWLLGLAGLIAVIVVGGYFVLKRDDIPYETLATRYESPASRYADLPGGIRMHYRDEGSPDAPVLLLIHGFSASLQTWEPWVNALATGEDRINDYRVISIDLPGHGLTRAPAGYQASIEVFRDVVAAFVQSQNLTSFALAGSSMGGNVAWEYALAHPDQVNALILVDASGWPEVRADLSEEPAVFKLLRNPVLGPAMSRLDNTRLIRDGLEASFVDRSLVTDAMVGRYSELARAPGHRDILLQMTLGFRERNFATPERLAPLRMPVLILTGDQDRLVPPEHAQQFHDAIAGSQLITFENVGHIPQEERPAESAMAVHEFLYQVYSPELALQ
ncbi:alpha/beta fold hydrolase [Terricaulis silvestris]|uniref:Lipase 3 n=1 Tax=Terricaulis silvestris TaxID=2686094 RepID=A0A6I6MP24_9CAUL|nr:alpha/beta hydrolase [Terricaulis silvestris]QGZ97120.1 Lipase 3 precursor [Terricaulis silvestris]